MDPTLAQSAIVDAEVADEVHLVLTGLAGRDHLREHLLVSLRLAACMVLPGSLLSAHEVTDLRDVLRHGPLLGQSGIRRHIAWEVWVVQALADH